MTLDRLLQQRGDAADIPPLDTWHPALSGDMDIVIHPDGTWQHEAIERRSGDEDPAAIQKRHIGSEQRRHIRYGQGERFLSSHHHLVRNTLS